MGLRKGWIELISKKAGESEPGIKPIVLLVATLFLALILGFIFLAFWTDRFFGFPLYPELPANYVFGGPLLIIGIVFWLWPAKLFFKAKGTPVPLQPPPKLITTGPYEFSRNPMLTGIFLILFGIGFAAQSISLVFIYTPLFIFLNVLEIKLIEEPELEKRLGQPYIDYKKRTPMFWPRRKKRV